MNATDVMRRVIEDQPSYIARQEEKGESARMEELRISEEFCGVSMHPMAEDPFGVVASLLHAISSWHLTAIAMNRFYAGEVGECEWHDAARHPGQPALPHTSERGG